MKTQVLNYLKHSLDDVRCANSILTLESFLFREKHDDFIPKYRVLVGDEEGDPVTSLDDLKSILVEANVSISPYTGNAANVSHTLNPVIVKLKNIHVDLRHIKEDSRVIASSYGRDINSIGFIMGYCNDNDASLPLKLLGVIMGYMRKD